MSKRLGEKIEVDASGYFNGMGCRPRIDLIRLIDRSDGEGVVVEMRGPNGMLGSYLCVDADTMDRLAETWRAHREQRERRALTAGTPTADSGSLASRTPQGA